MRAVLLAAIAALVTAQNAPIPVTTQTLSTSAARWLLQLDSPWSERSLAIGQMLAPTMRQAATYYHTMHPNKGVRVGQVNLLQQADLRRALCSGAQLTDCPIQIFHVTCEEAAEEIRRAQARGVKVFAETCPQYFVLTADDLDGDQKTGARVLCSPAPRTVADQQARGRGGDLSGVVLQAADRHQAGTGHQHEQGDECGDQQIKARQEAEPKEGKTRMDGHDSSWRDSERDDLLLSRQNRPGRDYTHPPPATRIRRSTQA